MAWYYTEGTIKKIVVGGNEVRFSLTPAERFLVEKDGKKGILFLVNEKEKWDAFARPEEKSLFSLAKEEGPMLLQIKRDHVAVRIYVGSKMSQNVAQLEIME
jgi:hypothetical protein